MAQAPNSRGRKGSPSRRLSGRNSFGVVVDTSELKQYLAQLGENAKNAVRPAAAAGAKVIYDRVKMNVDQLGRVTGNLSNSIYRVLSEDNSNPGKATYHISWNHIKAPHGHLVEFGYMRRYRYYQGDDGQVRPMVRTGMEHKRRPGRNASDAAKAAYYVLLPSPVFVPGKAFLASASSVFPQAVEAATEVFIKYMLEGAVDGPAYGN